MQKDNTNITLDKLKLAQTAIVSEVGGEGSLRAHFLDMGIIPGQKITLIQYAPLGDPMELQIGAYKLSLRKNEAAYITVSLCEEAETAEKQDSKQTHILATEHPGLGEGGSYHQKDHSQALPKDTILSFALIGNQNSGKTTLFNQLVGSNQRMENFSAIGTELKSGEIKGEKNTLVTDLPDIYSLAAYTQEESLSRRFLLEQKPKCIINIVDANNLERNLYLTMQLMELNIPIVLALNMMDELRGNGGSIRVNRMERTLGIPVVPISAARNEGIEELVQHAMHIAKYQEKPLRQDFCDKEEYGGAVHRCMHSIMHLIEDHALKAELPIRFAASRLVEGDSEIWSKLQLEETEADMIKHIVEQMEQERGLDRNAAMAQMRYSFVNKLCDSTVVKPTKSREWNLSRKIDDYLLGKWTAIPIFLIVMVGVIWLSVDALGGPLQELLQKAIAALATVCDNALSNAGVAVAIRSFVANGVFGGVGMVLSFLPILILMFFFLKLLEDSGYLSRVAFVSDKLLRKLGLSGRSIVPLMIGFGCSVPAVMAARSLPSSRDRRMTIFLAPYISCSAKIPIYVFFASAFFPDNTGLVLASLYLGAIVIGILVALVMKLLHKGEASPFVMEMPNYRMPSMKNVAMVLWDMVKEFVQKAFTVILIASVAIWALQSFDFSLHMVEPENSMLAKIAGLIAPIFGPIGLNDWRIVTSLISGFIAKESVVSSLQLMNVLPSISVLQAVSMLAFCLLYTPCVATITTVRRELGLSWALLMIVFQCFVAWLVACAAFNLAGLLI